MFFALMFSHLGFNTKDKSHFNFKLKIGLPWSGEI